MLKPLELALHPLMPVRTPRSGSPTTLYGYRLRLAGGPGLTHDDPLLRAFAVSVDLLEDPLADDEALQADVFDPGLPVKLVREGIDEDGDEVIGVWDADEIRRAGTLPYPTAARIAAGIDHGLDAEALIISEVRARADDRREGIALLVYPPALIKVDVAAGGPLQRPERRTRPRLVLIVEEGSGLRWWDPSGSAGPVDVDGLPVSAQLAKELRDLEALTRNATDPDTLPEFVESFEAGYQEYMLAERTRTVWARVRRELGRRYAVGVMLRGMSQPAWSPEELSDSDEDDDIPF